MVSNLTYNARTDSRRRHPADIRTALWCAKRSSSASDKLDLAGAAPAVRRYHDRHCVTLSAGQKVGIVGLGGLGRMVKFAKASARM